MKATVDIDFDFPSYEEDIAEAIKDEILNAVRLEVRRQSKAIRDAVAKKMVAEQRQLIDAALKALEGE